MHPCYRKHAIISNNSQAVKLNTLQITPDYPNGIPINKNTLRLNQGKEKNTK
jgi:hypothetical protein